MPGSPTNVVSWIAQGEETCPHCGQTYAYEVERTCVECDEPVCPFCVVIVREETHCPAHAEGGT